MSDAANTTATATATEKVNKSPLILAVLKARGLDVPAKDVQDAIKQSDGVDVTVSLINNIKSRVRAKKEARIAAKKKAAKRAQNVLPRQEESELDRLFKVKEFAQTVGGVEALKALLGKLEQLTAAA
jgi:hypothetical protein